VACCAHGRLGGTAIQTGGAGKLDLTGLVRNFLFAPLVDLSCAVDRAILLVRWRASVVPLVFPEDGSSHPQLHDFSVVWLVAAWQFSRRQIASPMISQFVSNWFRCRCYVGIPMMAQTPHRAMTAPTDDMSRMVTMRPLMTPPRASTGVRSRCMARSTGSTKFLVFDVNAGIESGLRPVRRPSTEHCLAALGRRPVSLD
jgi:hypothetical protein